MVSSAKSEAVRKSWQNPQRRIRQSEALKKCWQRDDYRSGVSEHLRRVCIKGNREIARLRKQGMIKPSDESRKKMSVSQKLRFQRPEELKKLERARSLQNIDYQARAKLMREAFLPKYGSFSELAKMGMRAPRENQAKIGAGSRKGLEMNGNMLVTER